MNLTDVDLTDLDVFEAREPWDVFDVLMREAPCFWQAERPPNHGFWAITRYADVVAILKDAETFSNERQGVTLEEPSEEELAARRNFLELDPPRHTRFRKLLAPDFTPRSVGRYEDWLRDLVRGVLDEVLPLGEFDLVEHVAAPIPIRVLGHILGVPDEHHARLIELSDRLIANTDPELATVTADSPESVAYRLEPFRSPDAAELVELGRRLSEERRRAPTDDVVSLLVNAAPDGCPFTQTELDTNFVMMVVAGNETTRSAISLGLLALADHPDQLALLRREPERISDAVDEMIRFSSPVWHFRRTTTRDVELHGQTIPEGGKVVVWFAAANRDPEVFPDPHRFDVTRAPTGNVHASFGRGGPHFCLGAHLARLETRVLLEELLPRIEAFELAGAVARVRSNFANGLKRMPVRVTLAA